jgi:hypothetical protein
MAVGGKLNGHPSHRAAEEAGKAFENKIAPVDNTFHLGSKDRAQAFPRHLKHHILPVSRNKQPANWTRLPRRAIIPCADLEMERHTR